MKKISLYQIEMIKGSYVIYLYNDLKFSFSNKRKAEDFLSVINQKLTNLMQLVNFELIEVYKIYRENYLLFDNYETINFEKQIKIVENAVDYIFNRLYSSNKNYFTYAKIEVIFEYMNEFYNDLDSFYKKRNYYNIIHIVSGRRILINRLYVEYFEFKESLEKPQKHNLTLIA
jgi:hypothetical protein